MPEPKTIDAFNPAQPSIPGLKPGEPKRKLSPPAPAVYSSGAPEEKAPPNPMLWVALTVLGALLALSGGFFYWMRSSQVATTGAHIPIAAAVPAGTPPAI